MQSLETPVWEPSLPRKITGACLKLGFWIVVFVFPLKLITELITSMIFESTLQVVNNGNCCRIVNLFVTSPLTGECSLSDGGIAAAREAALCASIKAADLVTETCVFGIAAYCIFNKSWLRPYWQPVYGTVAASVSRAFNFKQTFDQSHVEELLRRHEEEMAQLRQELETIRAGTSQGHQSATASGT